MSRKNNGARQAPKADLMTPSNLEVMRSRAKTVERNVQSDTGGVQIQSSVRYDLASHTDNNPAGSLSVHPNIAGIVGRSLTTAIPQAVAGIVAERVADIVDFVSSSESGEEFSNKLEQVFGGLDILQPGWRPTAQKAFPDEAGPHSCTDD